MPSAVSVVKVDDSGVVRDQAGHVLVNEQGQLACPDKRCRAQIDLYQFVAQLVAKGRLELDRLIQMATATEVVPTPSDPVDPNQIHAQWIELYQKWGLPKVMRVPRPTFNRDFVQRMKTLEEPRVPIFVHRRVTLPQLGKTFAQMDSWSTKEGSGVVDSCQLSGWLFVEEALEAPHRKTNQEQLDRVFKEQGAIGLNETSYIVFGQYCQEVHGRYPDLESWTRLLSSAYKSLVLGANFDSDGRLFVSRVFNPLIVDPCLGGRSAVMSGTRILES